MGRVFTKGWELSVDARITANATAISNQAVKRLDVTIATTDWTLNQTTNKYEYTGNNAHVTANTYIDVVMDDENAVKMVDGSISSSNGSFTIVTSEVPASSVSMTLILTETTDVTPAGN
jgi:hypothetical protein